MNTQALHTYLLRAIEAYPYDLTQTLEALNYALSIDPDNAHALSLMAQLCHEQLDDYEQAKDYYEAALASRLDLPKVYPKFIFLLLQSAELDEAQRVIDFALTVKGIDRASIMAAQGQLFEQREQFENAEEALQKAKFYAYNAHFLEYVDGELNRIKLKKKIQFRTANATETEMKQPQQTAESKNWFMNRLNNLL